MADQGLSGDAPRHGPNGPNGFTGDAKGSRTPGVGAANGRRADINIESPPLPIGTPIFPEGPFSPSDGSHPAGRIFTPTLCVCGHTLLAHLSPDAQEMGVLGCSGFRPVSAEGPVLGTERPLWKQQLDQMSDAEVDDLHAHLLATAGVTLVRDRASGSEPDPHSYKEAPWLLRVLIFTPLIIVLVILAGILFLGYRGGADD